MMLNQDELEFLDLIDSMDNEERKSFREWLIETSGDKQLPLPRNLFFNYETQEWII